MILSPVQKGLASVVQFVLWAIQDGWEIAVPLDSTARYDLVVLRPSLDQWETVQVKTARTRRSCKGIRVNIDKRQPGSTPNEPYCPGDFDLLAAVHSEGIWVFPASSILEQDYQNLMLVNAAGDDQWPQWRTWRQSDALGSHV